MLNIFNKMNSQKSMKKTHINIKKRDREKHERGKNE